MPICIKFILVWLNESVSVLYKHAEIGKYKYILNNNDMYLSLPILSYSCFCEENRN